MISPYNLNFAALGCLGIAGMFALGLIHPPAFREDGYIEGLSAVLFASAMIIAIWRLVGAWRSGAPAERLIALGALAGFAALLSLSEISFGARLFSLQMPQIRGGGEFDGGHDFVIVIYRYATSDGRTPTAIAILLFALAVGAALLWRFRSAFVRSMRYVLADRLAFRVACILGLLALAVALDLVSSHKAMLLEESIEFCVSVMYVVTLCDWRPTDEPVVPPLPIPGADEHLLR